MRRTARHLTIPVAAMAALAVSAAQPAAAGGERELAQTATARSKVFGDAFFVSKRRYVNIKAECEPRGRASILYVEKRPRWARGAPARRYGIICDGIPRWRREAVAPNTAYRVRGLIYGSDLRPAAAGAKIEVFGTGRGGS